MEKVSARMATLRPAAFSQQLLNALAASEGRTKRRKRDQTPDAIGLGIKRALLVRAAEEDPAPEAFEGWLMSQAFDASDGGGVRAMCVEILDEYRLAAVDSRFHSWLEEGAPSADADTPESPGASRERPAASAEGEDPEPPRPSGERPAEFVASERGRVRGGPAGGAEQSL